MDKTLFVSYARNSIGEALIPILCRKVEEYGFRAVYDRDALLGGDNWREVIDDKIKLSWAMIALINRDAAKSKYIHYEYGVAIGAGKPIIPILLEKLTKSTPIHPRLDPTQYIDFTRVYDWPSLKKALQREDLKIEVRQEMGTSLADAIKSIVLSIAYGKTSASDIAYGLAMRKLISIEDYDEIIAALDQQATQKQSMLDDLLSHPFKSRNSTSR